MTPWILSKNKFHSPSLYGQFLCGVYAPTGIVLTSTPEPPIDKRCKICAKKVQSGRVPR